MIELKAQKRDKLGRKTKRLRKEGVLPGVLYGAGIKSVPVEVDAKEFEDVYEEVGESSLVSLRLKGKEGIKVLIHELSYDPLSGEVIHADFYHPSAKKRVEVEIPIHFEGESPAVSDLKGTLIREIQSIQVKGLPQNLPKEIKVDVSSLETFEDRILVKDLNIPTDVTITRGEDEIVALVVPPREEEEVAAAEEPIVVAEEEEVVEEAEEAEGAPGEEEVSEETEEKTE